MQSRYTEQYNTLIILRGSGSFKVIQPLHSKNFSSLISYFFGTKTLKTSLKPRLNIKPDCYAPRLIQCSKKQDREWNRKKPKKMKKQVENSRD